MSGAEFLLAALVGIMLVMLGAVALVQLAAELFSLGRLRFTKRGGS